jgi:uncharacterized protein YjcR
MLSHDTQDMIANAYASGVPLKVIANKYGCEASTACCIAKRKGIKLRKQGGSLRHKRILELLSSGMRAIDVANEVGCVLQTVYNAKNKAAQSI